MAERKGLYVDSTLARADASGKSILPREEIARSQWERLEETAEGEEWQRGKRGSAPKGRSGPQPGVRSQHTTVAVLVDQGRGDRLEVPTTKVPRGLPPRSQFPVPFRGSVESAVPGAPRCARRTHMTGPGLQDRGPLSMVRAVGVEPASAR